MRRLGWILPLLLAALLLPACSDELDPDEVVGGATDATIDAGTAKVHASVRVEGPNDVRANSEGGYDFARRRGSSRTSVAGRDVASVMVGERLYEKVPGLVDQTGTHWLGIDLGAIAAVTNVQQATMALDAATADPGRMLAYLRGAGAVRERGSAKIRGASTTRYRTEIDYERAAKAAPRQQRKAIRLAAKLFGVDEQPVDVWVDGEGRVRRLVETFDYSKMELPEGVDLSQVAETATMTLDFFDFGTAVDVDLPDEDDVTDVSGSTGTQPVTPTPEHVVLERSLLTDVPPGFEQQPDDVGDTGPSDLAKAKRDAGRFTAGLLDDGGFVAGYQRLWVKGDDDAEIVVYLYEFESPEAAAAYAVKFHLDLTAEVQDGGGTIFDVAGVPGAQGTGYDDGEGFLAHHVDFTSGPYVVRVVTNGDGSSPELVSSLARQQLARLR